MGHIKATYFYGLTLERRLVSKKEEELHIFYVTNPPKIYSIHKTVLRAATLPEVCLVPKYSQILVY